MKMNIEYGLEEKLKEKSDIKNMASCIELNFELIEKICKNYQKCFYRLAYKRTQNVEKAKDITQNTLEAICKRVGKKNKIYNLDAWLYTILKYKCYDTFRNKSTIQYYPNDVLENYIIENEIDTLENIDLYNALKDLKEVDRKIIICRYVYGFKNSEIARFCECNNNTVKRKIEKSLLIMREKLKQY